jgi:hypothetical protein
MSLGDLHAVKTCLCESRGSFALWPVDLPRSTYGPKVWISARRWWKACEYACPGIFEYFVSRGRSASGDCSRQKDTFAPF